MTEYIFKKPYITNTGSVFYVGEKYPESYLKDKVPNLMKDFSTKDEYLVATSNVSFEDVTSTTRTLGEDKSRTLSTFEIKEKADIADTTIYINDISFEDLIKIQGISEKTATKLINSRKDKRFETVEELSKIATTVKWDKYNLVY